MSRVYPNLYVLLVAPPGVGKSVSIFQSKDLLERSRKLHLAPDDVTKASLLDHLAKAMTTKLFSPTEMYQYHSLQIIADEFGVLCPSHDPGFLSVMNALYDNRNMYRESRRGREGDLVIQNPQVNLLAGTQPDFLANLLPPEAWGMGFMSRMLMVYQGKSEKPKLFGKRLRVDTKDLLEDLKTICELHGEVDWEPEAADFMEATYEDGILPAPEHTKLKHYVPRRGLTCLKLAIISACARGNGMVIDKSDVERAIDWLLEIEGLMPDVFKDMSGQGDGMLIQDLHGYMWQWCNKNKNEKGELGPMHRSRIEQFLSQRTPSYNVENIIKLCKSAKIIIEKGPDMFIPGNANTLRSE